ncbi:MAG TPA: Wzt carbohydrate-binding domain-containing protein, partial [Solirubrobacteraceae bacterium]|nr:Wzt carbohydrate-binding domain-containing protein [Solirubrobacteraceae bacterium]
MLVRLAFAVMVQADADILLIDEVLAVGDAAFARKCMDVFYERRRLGKTVVLVTHDMATVQSLCHRAMLLHDGAIQYIGDPEDAALRYYRLNFGAAGREAAPGAGPEDLETVSDLNVRLVRAVVRGPAGQTLEGIEQGHPIEFEVVFAAARHLSKPLFTFNILNAAGVVVAEFSTQLEGDVPAGHQVALRGWIENKLVADRYYLDCWMGDVQESSRLALQALRVLSFVVYGTAARHGLVTLQAEIEATVETGPDDH